MAYCAVGASFGEAAHKDTVDPEAWAIHHISLGGCEPRKTRGAGPARWEEDVHRASFCAQAAARASSRGRQALLGPHPLFAAGMAGKREGAYWTSRSRLGDCQEFAGTRDRRTALRRFSAHGQVRATRRRAWGRVGGQVARDAAGNVVSKADTQAQVEQVGKNVGVCLGAAGATVQDIIFTVSYVTQPAEFDKYPDLRQRYFGPPSPNSATVPVPQLAGPDFLVQVEAFAKIR